MKIEMRKARCHIFMTTVFFYAIIIYCGKETGWWSVFNTNNKGHPVMDSLLQHIHIICGERLTFGTSSSLLFIILQMK